MSDGGPEYLLQLVGGDRVVAREILGEFLASDTKDRASLAEAMQAGNTAQVLVHAHRITGGARSIGANLYATAAADVEMAAVTGGNLAAAVANLEACARDVAAWTWDLQ